MSLRKRVRSDKVRDSGIRDINHLKQFSSSSKTSHNGVKTEKCDSGSFQKIGRSNRGISQKHLNKNSNKTLPSRLSFVNDNIQHYCTFHIVLYSIIFLVLTNYGSHVYLRHHVSVINHRRARRLVQANVSGRQLMIETAKLYQNNPDSYFQGAQKLDQFRYWAQEIGLSYFEYYRGRYYTPKQSEGLPHSQCFQWPDPRTRFTFLAVSTRSTFVGSGNMIMTPYALAYGGWRGAVKDDLWLFIRGLLDGKKTLDIELNVTKKFAYIPKNLGGDTLAQVCEERNPLQCNRCGRWHKLNPQPEGRGLTDCRYYADEILRALNAEKATVYKTQWCPEALERYKRKSINVDIGRASHSSSFIYRDKAVMEEGIMVTFGGETRTTLSNSVWYLNKMPIPTAIANEPTYADTMASDFLCLRTFASNEVYPPRRICPKKSAFTDMQGEIHSGKLLPQSECLWTIEPNVSQSKDYIIVLDVQKLDLDNPPYTCKNYITIKDTSDVAVGGKYNNSFLGTTLFHGCSLSQMTTTTLAAVNGKISVHMFYESMCPSHSGFTANFTVHYVDDERISCDGLDDCNGNGDCLAGKCDCDTGYSGSTCGSKCDARDASCGENSQAQEDVFPRPRMGHVASSTFSESYTNVVHRTYSRTVSEPVVATAQELLSAQSDIAVIYSQDCCKCHSGPESPCTLDANNNSKTDRCEGNWIDGCTWDPHFTMQRTNHLQREIQSFQCSATKAPAPDSQGKAQNKLDCYAADDPDRVAGRQDAVRVRKRDITGFDSTALGDVCRSTWQFPDKFKLAFDCETKKAEIDAEPQLKWGEDWSDSRICQNVTEWIPQNAIKQELEAEFLRAFGQTVIVTINLGYSATILTGGGADKVEQMEWHDSVNFGGGCKGSGEQKCPIRTSCATDGDNSLSAVFCIANEGTDEYNQQCVCENNDPMEHLPEVCSKMGTNVVTIEWVNIPECHGKDAKLPFCDLPELYMTERESDLTISFTNQAQADSDCLYEAKYCGCDCKKDGISPYYVIMEGNKSREVFFNDITQEPSTQYNSQYNEMNESKIVNNSLFTVPIRVERSQIDFKMPDNISIVLQKTEDGDIICGEECEYVCADTCGGDGCPNTYVNVIPPSTQIATCGDNTSDVGCGWSSLYNCWIQHWDAWDCGTKTVGGVTCFKGPKYHTKYSYEKFLILDQFQLRDTNPERGQISLYGNKTTTAIASDSYESNSSTWGEGAQIVIFGGWDGERSLNDLWSLSVQEQLGAKPPNRTCKTKILGTGNNYRLVEVASTEYIIRPRFGFEIGDIDYMPCSNINWTKHAFFPNFHKINKWRKIPESTTGTPPAPRYFHTSVKVGSFEDASGYSKNRYRLMVFGGYNDVTGMGRNDLWELSLPARYQNQSSYKWTEVQTTGEIPPKRWHQAMALLRRDSGNYIFIYGGWNGNEALNDIYMISTDSTYNTTLIWEEFTKTRGSWHMNYFAIPFLPFDSLAGLPGFVGRHILEEKLPKRYGHALVPMTSSFDGVNETRDILMSFSGSQENEMSMGLNLDAYGLFWGGKATAAYYICPDVDMACSHPTYKGVGGLTFSLRSLRASHALAFIAFFYANPWLLYDLL